MGTLAADVLNLIAVRCTAELEHCRICGRGLKDPTSVDIGIGPKCRKDCGYADAWAKCADTLKLCASCFRDLGSAVDWKLTDKPREGQS